MPYFIGPREDSTPRFLNPTSISAERFPGRGQLDPACPCDPQARDSSGRGVIPPLLDNWTFGLFFRRRASDVDSLAPARLALRVPLRGISPARSRVPVVSSLTLPPWVALGLPPRPAPKSLRQKIQFSQRGGINRRRSVRARPARPGPCFRNPHPDRSV
jgi:hypothetical protein